MLKRFTVSLEDSLLAEFDALISRRRYSNRSEAIRDLIRTDLVEQVWQSDTPVMGVITLVYDHHQHQLQEKVTRLQHEHHQQVVSTTHVHMDGNNCLEVVVVKGSAPSIQDLAHRLRALRGIRDCQLAMSSTGRDLP
jgi:CopG family nickel-responsive transcriptional regulator